MRTGEMDADKPISMELAPKLTKKFVSNTSLVAQEKTAANISSAVDALRLGGE
jgi:hypothetical protein